MGSKIDYNLHAKLKKLKKQAQTFFTAGYSPKVVSGMMKLSLELVTAWHDDFVREVLQGSPTKRLFLREMLLKNAPAMILTLVKLANQDGDEKLKYSAASSVLAFASKFMNEDIKIKAIEDKVIGDSGADPTISRGLFDFVDPDLEAEQQMQLTEKKEELSVLEEKYAAEIFAAFEDEEKEEEESGEDYRGSGPPPDERQDLDENVLDVFDGLGDD